VSKYPFYCMIFLLIDRLSRAKNLHSRGIETRGNRLDSMMCNFHAKSIRAVSMHAGASTVYTLSVGGVTWKTALKKDRCVYMRLYVHTHTYMCVCVCVCVNRLAK